MYYSNGNHEACTRPQKPEDVNNKSFGMFQIIWIVELISSIGSGLTSYGLGIYVYLRTLSYTSVSLVTLCAFLPLVLLNPIGGVFADRFDRRLMMIIGNIISAVGIMFILFIMINGEALLWFICLGILLSSISVSFSQPAYKAIMTDLVTKEEFARASGLVQLSWACQYLISPIIARVLLSISNIKIILGIDALTFLVSAFTILIVRRVLGVELTEPKKQNFFNNLIQGLNNILEKKGVLWISIILSLVTFCVGIIQGLFEKMILSFSNVKTFETIITVSSIGMLVGSLFIVIFSINKRYIKVLSISLAIGGISLILIGVSNKILLIGMSALIFFAVLPFVNTSADVIIRSNIKNEVQGRVWAIIGAILQFAYLIAYIISEVLSNHVFEPLLKEGRILSSTVGTVIGVLFIIVGIFIMITVYIMGKIKVIKDLDTL